MFIVLRQYLRVCAFMGLLAVTGSCVLASPLEWKEAIPGVPGLRFLQTVTTNTKGPRRPAYVLEVNLKQPGIGVLTILKNDSVDENPGQTVAGMCKAHTNDGVVAGINAAYFAAGINFKPQGLCCINGSDKTQEIGIGDSWRHRTVLAFDKRNTPSMLKFPPDAKTYSAQDIFNAIAAGPSFMRDSEYYWPALGESEADLVPKFERVDRVQSVAGLSKDRTKLYLIVVGGRSDAEGITCSDLWPFLKSVGVSDAMKLDGGSKSTLWLNGKVIYPVPGTRSPAQVASALAITYKSTGASPKEPPAESSKVDLSGRWAGKAKRLDDGQQYEDRMSVMQTGDKLYYVSRRHIVGSDSYYVTANESPVDRYIGEFSCSGDAPSRMLEIRGSWEWAIWSKRSLSPDGETIFEESKFSSGHHMKGSLNRTGRLASMPEIGRIAHEFKGMVKLGAQVAAGKMTVKEAQQYLLVFLNYPGSRLELIATGPDGKVVTDQSPGVTYLADEIPARLYVRNPKPGDWRFAVEGVEVEGDQEPFWVLATYTDKGPDGMTTSASVPVRAATDWQTPLLISTIVGIFILSILCVAFAIRRRNQVEEVDPGDNSVICWLQVHESGSPPRNHPVTGNLIRIGRDESNDLVLADPQTSGFHAEFRTDGQSAQITDLGSTSGTSVGGNMISEHVLRHGDAIRIGNVDIYYLLSDGEYT